MTYFFKNNTVAKPIKIEKWQLHQWKCLLKYVSGRHMLTLIFHFLFVAKIICRELYLDPEKKVICSHLSSLTKVLKGLRHFPISDLDKIIVCYTLGKNYYKTMFFFKSVQWFKT